MKHYSLDQKLAIVGLDGLDAVNMTIAKKIVLRGISIARALEEWIPKMEGCDSGTFQKVFLPTIDSAMQMSKKQLKMLEQEMTDDLKEKDILEEVQDLLACDMYYETGGMSMRQYRSRPETYLMVRELVRAEVLEEGILSIECICLLWLLRETGVLHEFFTVAEQETVQDKLTFHAAKQPVVAGLLETQAHRTGEVFGVKYLKMKKKIFHNPYLQGVNLMFPFLERRQGIFIDFVVLGTDVAGRRQQVISHLQERGHYVEEIRYQEETLLKIDNGYYRVFPTTRWAKLPIQGVSLIPFYS